ncbi:hypothetical protein Gpo141_00008726 [Globisporangium polare]
MDTANVARGVHSKSMPTASMALSYSSKAASASGFAGNKASSPSSSSSGFSLSLVAKKKEILQSEVVKLETCLRKRAELLCRLRQNHEKLLTANGNLQ